MALLIFIYDCKLRPKSQTLPEDPPPSPQQSPSIQNLNLNKEIDNFYQLIQSDNFDPQSCPSKINAFYNRLFTTKIPNLTNSNQTSSNKPEIIDQLWNISLALHQKLKYFISSQKLEKECAVDIQRFLSASRYLIDSLGEIKLMSEKSETEELSTSSFINKPYILINPIFKDFNITNDLKSGDIILTRDNSFADRAITKINKPHSPYSYLSLIYVDEKTGDKHVIEAHPSRGFTITPLEQWLQGDLIRITVFRYAYFDIAKKVAKFTFVLLSKQINTDEEDEIVSKGNEKILMSFEFSNQETLLVPLVSNLSKAAKPILADKLGLNNITSFQPADIEMRENFTIVAEWRNFSRTRISRHQDIALNKIYEWIEKKDYRLQPNLQSFFTHKSLTEEEKSKIFGKVDADDQLISEKLYDPIIQLYELSNRIQKYMEVAEEKRLAKYRFAMTVLELSDGYDYLRETDYKIYLSYMVWKDQHDGLGSNNQPKLKKGTKKERQPDKPIFHFLFRPDTTAIVRP